MKKSITALLVATLLAGCSSTSAASSKASTAASSSTKDEPTAVVAELPAPQDETKEYKANKDDEKATKCAVGVYSPDCSSINSSNLKDYLGRTDVLYIDLRDYTDYAATHLRNFEVVPYFAAIMNTSGENITQLYSGSVEEPVATYEESDELLEAFFPKDTTIFFMCQSGGRVAKLMKLLEVKGYDMTKIYNVGGMAQYATSEYTDITTQTGELVVEATYNFDGLTPAN